MKTGSPRMSIATLRLAGLCLLVPALSACTSLLGGGKHNTSIYAPEMRAIDAQDWPQVRWQLALGRTTGARTADSQRIMVRPAPNELQVYKDAQWAKSPGDMLEDAVLHALEDSGRIASVSRQGSGIASDYRLLLDVRRFESDYAGAAVPSATIEVTAKLLHVGSQELAGTRTFLQRQQAASPGVPSVVDAFRQALEKTSSDIAGWTLHTGENHARKSTR